MLHDFTSQRQYSSIIYCSENFCVRLGRSRVNLFCIFASWKQCLGNSLICNILQCEYISLVALNDQLCGTRAVAPNIKKNQSHSQSLYSRKHCPSTVECLPVTYLQNARVRLLKVTDNTTEIIQWLRFTLSTGHNRVGVFHTFTWIWKKIQFLRCCVL